MLGENYEIYIHYYIPLAILGIMILTASFFPLYLDIKNSKKNKLDCIDQSSNQLIDYSDSAVVIERINNIDNNLKEIELNIEINRGLEETFSNQIPTTEHLTSLYESPIIYLYGSIVLFIACLGGVLYFFKKKLMVRGGFLEDFIW